ncbi:Uncharacterised protein [Acinetobacter baumannii]|nr:Uncharacterised protein [Acinetobacter baumannii]
MFSNRLCDNGISGPATTPWITRKKISMPRLLEMPHSQEARANSAVDQRNSRTSPKRFASQPVIGIEMAFATPNEVITQVPCELEDPRLPEMVGIATLAMVESSTCMKVAMASATVIQASWAPSSGFCGKMASRALSRRSHGSRRRSAG